MRYRRRCRLVYFAYSRVLETHRERDKVIGSRNESGVLGEEFENIRKVKTVDSRQMEFEFSLSLNAIHVTRQ